ncbi:hypothetical protein EDB87DRAFT_1578372 [Lactarius vividus]|nr:hypothetical protein EDB87DRAFT_1578372 [Lactarius vividus]
MSSSGRDDDDDCLWKINEPGEGYGSIRVETVPPHDNAVNSQPFCNHTRFECSSRLLGHLPQAKQAIIPALLGMVKFTEVHAQARSSSVTQPSAVMELLGSNSGVASAGGAHAGYQMYQRPFSSSSGSGYTIWYSSRIGCSALVDNGKVLPKMRNVPTIMTGSFPFAVMGSQVGLHEQQSARQRLEGRRE